MYCSPCLALAAGPVVPQRLKRLQILHLRRFRTIGLLIVGYLRELEVPAFHWLSGPALAVV